MPETLVSGVRLLESERKRIEKLIEMGYHKNFADFLRYAVRTKLQEFEFVFVRDIDFEIAKKEVLEFVKKKPKVYADEIAKELDLDIETVIKAIDKLIEEKELEVAK
ncbi:MAG TPA: hypothetical protein EYP22_00950 [Methanosarcinales archaeon]|nr:hypothetical protein [Methanosarcinales archaeon]